MSGLFASHPQAPVASSRVLPSTHLPTCLAARPAPIPCPPARYEALAQRYPAVPEYQLYWAQSLCKAGLFAEAGRAAAGVEGLQQASTQHPVCHGPAPTMQSSTQCMINTGKRGMHACQ